MPVGINVSAGNVTTNTRLNALLESTYQTSLDSDEQELAKKLSLNATTDVNTIDLAAFYDPPTIARWSRGSHIPMGSFGDFSKSHTLTRIGMKLVWEIDDEEDDRLNQLPSVVEATAEEFAKFQPRGVFEYLAGSASLMPSLDTLYDGLSLFSSSTRGSVSGGNIVTGTGITAEGIRNDFYSAVARAGDFRRETATGEFYWQGSNLADPKQWLIVAPFDADMMRVMKRAFGQERTLDELTLGAAVSNEFAGGNSPEIHYSQRLTGDDWFLFYLGNSKIRPFMDVKHTGHESPMPLEQREDGSDITRDYNQRGKGWKQRLGWFPLHWQGAIKIDN